MHMAQYCNPCFNANLVFDGLGHFKGAPHSFRQDYYTVEFAAVPAVHYSLAHVLHAGVNLGNNYALGSSRQTGVKAYVPRIPAHNLYDICPVVGGCCIPNPANSFHHGIHRGIKADGIVTKRYIIVYGPRYAHHLYSHGGQVPGAPEGPVAAYNHQPLDAEHAHHVQCLFPALGRGELRAPGGLQHGPSPVNYIRHR